MEGRETVSPRYHCDNTQEENMCCIGLQSLSSFITNSMPDQLKGPLGLGPGPRAKEGPAPRGDPHLEDASQNTQKINIIEREKKKK